MAKKLLNSEFGWQDYGGHHYENIYSKSAFGWYQYFKFWIDKRKVTLSGQVRSGLITKDKAKKYLAEAPIVNTTLIEYVYSKLGLSKEEFENIIKHEPK